MLRRLSIALLALGLTTLAAQAACAQTGISQKVAVCNPSYPTQCAKPDSSGALPITGSISASSSEHSTAAAPTYVEGTDNALSGDLAGNLRTINPSVGATSSAVKTSSTLVGVSDGTNQQPLVAPIGLGDGVNGNNMFSVGAWAWNGTSWDRAPGNTTGLIVQGVSGMTPFKVDPSVTYTAGPYDGTNNKNPAGFQQAIADAAISTAASAVKPQAQTTGGCTPSVALSAASNNSTLISTGAHTLCKLVLVNTTSTIYYVRTYDSASAPTCSSATGATAMYPVPAQTTGAGIAVPLGPFGEAYTSGLGFCITGASGLADNTNAATGVTLNYSYK